MFVIITKNNKYVNSIERERERKRETETETERDRYFQVPFPWKKSVTLSNCQFRLIKVFRKVLFYGTFCQQLWRY